MLSDTSATVCVAWALDHLSGQTCPGGLLPALHVTPPAEYTAIEAFLYSCSVHLQIPVHELTSEVLIQSSSKDSNTSALLQSCPEYLHDTVTCRILVACAARRLR